MLALQLLCCEVANRPALLLFSLFFFFKLAVLHRTAEINNKKINPVWLQGQHYLLLASHDF